MTMPHLTNCNHSEDGWCLDCVKALWEECENGKQFLNQTEGKAERRYPQGRMGGDDEGVLVIAVIADHQHKTILMRFGNPVEWIGFSAAEACNLITLLEKQISILEGKR